MIRSLAASLCFALFSHAALPAAGPEKIEELKAQAAKVEQADGPESPSVADALDALSSELESQTRFADAEPLRKRALAIRQKAFGPEHPRTTESIAELGALYYTQGRYPEAESLLKQALQIRERTVGAETPGVADLLGKLADLYMDQSRHEEAEKAIRRGLAIREKAFAPDHRDIGESLNALGKIFIYTGRDREAEPLYRRSLAILRAAVPDSYEVAIVLNNLAELCGFQGRDKEAEPLYKESLVLFEKALHPEHPDLAVPLSNIARLYLQQGRDREAEPFALRALAIREKVLGPKHPDVGNSLSDLAHLNQHRGRYTEAEPLFKRILAIREESLEPDNHDVATAVNDLAVIFSLQRRYDDAIPLLERSLNIYEKLSLESNDTASASNNLALAYLEVGRFPEAEPLFLRSLEIAERVYGPNHPETATTLNNLGEFYRTQSRLAEAEPYYLRSLAIREKVLGKEHPLVAQSFNNLAVFYEKQGRVGESRTRYRDSIALYERSLGPDHPALATTLYGLAALEQSQKRGAEALAVSRRGTRIARARIIGGSSDDDVARTSAANRPGLYRHVALLAANPAKEPRQRVAGEAFEVAQLLHSTGTASAVAKMAARFATGDDALAALVKRKQEIAEQTRRKDAELMSAASRTPDKRDAPQERTIRSELGALDTEMAKVDAELQARFPSYQVLTRPDPLALSTVQRLMRPQEALIAYSVAGDAAWMWVVRRDRAVFLPLAATRKSLAELVGKIRVELQPTSTGILQNIDVRALHQLYRVVFAPAAPHLATARDIMVVPAGPLESLPFAILIASPPREIRTPADYRSIDWLAKRYAISVLPSVGSIRALREFARPVTARQPFAGFGDPQLTDETSTAPSRGAKLTPAVIFRSLKSDVTGAHMDVADVAAIKSSPSLPETADELRAMARLLKAGEESLWMRSRATEIAVKQLDLASYRVIAFATHGVTAGELSGIREPGLLLTPPDKGTPEDDGYLSASEIAQLKMNADWVLLSACNTAAADGTPGAEGLSGLAKAFFYAGSRSLFVSHWPVASEATVPLTTAMLREYQAHPAQGKAEAHRKAMLALMNTPGHPEYAHPFFWAPFVVVGEGGAQQAR